MARNVTMAGAAAAQLARTFYLFSFLALLVCVTLTTSLRDNEAYEYDEHGNKGHRRNLPMFAEVPDNVTAAPGERAVLLCSIENLGTKTVIWRRKHEDHPLGVGRFTFTGDTRISVQFDERSGNWSLVISEVKPSDDGVYVCQISTKPVKSYDIRLNVKAIQVSGTPYVETGSQTYLVCNATGYPDPPRDIEWFKDGEKVNSDAQSGILITKAIKTNMIVSVLVIKKSRMEHAGVYICRSSNLEVADLKVHVLNVATTNVKRGTQLQHVKSGAVKTGTDLSILTLLLISFVAMVMAPRGH